MRNDGNGGSRCINGFLGTLETKPISGVVKEVRCSGGIEVAEVLCHKRWGGNGPAINCVGGKHAVESDVGKVVGYAEGGGGS